MSKAYTMTSNPIENKKTLNSLVFHPLQTYEWGEFRKKTGVEVIQSQLIKNGKPSDVFQLTLHKIPHTPWFAGYLPKGNIPTRELIDELKEIGKRESCIFIQLEPNVKESLNFKSQASRLGLIPAAHPLFTKYTFVLDLTKNEEELLKNMHYKTLYNIRVAQKRGVIVKEDNSPSAFEKYLSLTSETTKRQQFFAHTHNYHRKMWETLKPKNTQYEIRNTNELTAHLLTASYKDKTLVAWIVFVFKDTLYYPYGASSSENREVMASNLMMWEAIRFGKKLGLKKFDMWGALSSNPDSNDPWYGFHRFKQGYGPDHVEFVGSFDIVINPFLYQVYKIADKIRWALLRK